MNIRLIGAPSAWGTLELGAQRTPGVLREAGVATWLAEAGHMVDDHGDIDVLPQHPSDVPSAEQCAEHDGVLHAAEVASMASSLHAAVDSALDDGALPLIIGGECSVSLGAVSALAQRAPVTVAWLDAHGDLNTPATSTSGLATGMPLATILGHGDDELLAVGAGAPRPTGDATFLVGGRDLDAGERDNLAEFGVQHIDTTAARAVGPEEVAMQILGVPEVCVAPPEARQYLAATNPGIADMVASAPRPNLYVHFDVDVLDPTFAPGVHYPVGGGFDPSEVATLIGYLAASGCIGALSIASANLDHDVEGTTVGSIRDVFTSVADALATL